MTVSVTLVVRVRPPPVPVMVSVKVPVGVVAEVVTVMAEEAPVAGLGVKLAAAPAGNPLTPKVTPAVKFVRAMLTV